MLLGGPWLEYRTFCLNKRKHNKFEGDLEAISCKGRLSRLCNQNATQGLCDVHMDLNTPSVALDSDCSSTLARERKTKLEPHKPQHGKRLRKSLHALHFFCWGIQRFALYRCQPKERVAEYATIVNNGVRKWTQTQP